MMMMKKTNKTRPPAAFDSAAACRHSWDIYNRNLVHKANILTLSARRNTPYHNFTSEYEF
jgi:hypothetical protein